MLRRSAGHGSRVPRGGPDPRRVRLLALLGVVACAVVLPLAVASAGQVGDLSGTDDALPRGDDKMPSAAPARSPLVLGPGLATAAHRGPEITSPGGVEAPTCVVTRCEDTWARTYYRNATGRSGRRPDPHGPGRAHRTDALRADRRWGTGDL
ncbi:hypothetical protein [Streptomyces sp. NPDC001292]|uniref:hypothetical protein n=1 Tax=Streptomyces sp. NPDC001292 TaxID=3364558 RepID=UPI0036B21D3B